MNSFIENVNYLASLDNSYGDGIVLNKNNLSLRNVANDITLKFSYFNYDTRQIETVTKGIQGMLYTGLGAALQEFIAQIEATLGGNKFDASYTISSSNTGFLIHSFSITINSLDEKLKCTEINFNAKITSTQVEIYNLYGDVINPLKLLPVLAMLEPEVVNAIPMVYENIDSIIYINSNIDLFNDIKNNIIPNINEILEADNNALIASQKALDASASAVSALSSATTATIKESEALVSANSAATSATNASISKTQSATSAEQSATSASTATTKAAAADVSATNASNSATASTAKASEASTSASNASLSATNSANSATSAATSATASSTSATNSANSATAAAASAASAAAIVGGISLDSLNNVTAPTPANGDILSYVTATTDWRPLAILPATKGGTGVVTSTGSGNNVLSTSPTLVTPNIGVATGTSFNSITGLSSVVGATSGTAAVGTSTTAARADHVHPVQTTITGNAGTATKLATARTITLSGDVSGSTFFDGSGNVSITTIVADDSHLHSFANTTNKPTTVSGYGIIDAYTKAEVNTKIDTVISDSSTSTSSTWSSYKIDESITTAVGAIDLSSKQDTLVSGTNIKTVNSSSILGSGNLALLTSINPVITGSITEQVYNLTGTAINPANGTIQYKTVSANTTFTETLTSGQSVLLRLIGANNYTTTFPTITWVGAAAPVLTANCAIVLWKEQSTLYGSFVGTLV